MEAQQWQYFDFSGVWDTFKRLWTSETVQHALGQHLLAWCSSRGVECSWQAGDDLWQHSCNKYWERQAEQQARSYAALYGSSRFRRAMAQLIGPFPSAAAASAAFDAICLPTLLEDFLPKPGTLQSLLIMGGRNQVVVPALELVALELWPNEAVTVEKDATGDLTVVNKSRSLLLDPFGFFFHREGRPGYDPSQRAAELLERGWEYETNDVM